MVLSADRNRSHLRRVVDGERRIATHTNGGRGRVAIKGLLCGTVDHTFGSADGTHTPDPGVGEGA